MGVLAAEGQFYLVRMTPGAGHLPFSYASEARPAQTGLSEPLVVLSFTAFFS